MKKQSATILERVNEIEKNLQSLKVDYILNLPDKQKKLFQFYKDKDIVTEIRKTRKKLWNERYSKVI